MCRTGDLENVRRGGELERDLDTDFERDLETCTELSFFVSSAYRLVSGCLLDTDIEMSFVASSSALGFILSSLNYELL